MVNRILCVFFSAKSTETIDVNLECWKFLSFLQISHSHPNVHWQLDDASPHWGKVAKRLRLSKRGTSCPIRKGSLL
ncbi:hypothetical protein CEXT_680731 [Caerostris extrusa]|uniref:Uncharacterized protein n=1 Tax=Caerostris extrusa TaxID=172846 RepID=A0AAV4NEM9_CAEEX|nr:hypothetical protein CEXT_680731 [Caerostris extrusa]